MILPERSVSVIIPSARPAKVIDTIDGVLSQTIAASILDILVVTPKNCHHIDEIKKRGKVEVLLVEELYPPGKMRNIGAKSAKGKYLAFIDDDCIPENAWLEKVLKEMFLNSDTGMIGCRVLSGKKIFWAETADYTLFSAYQYRKRLKVDLGSAAVVIKKEAFAEAKGFDESLLASEDWDFSLRLRVAGWQCLYTPEAEVRHFHGRESFTVIVKNAYFSGYRSGLVVQKRHYSRMSWLAKVSVKLGAPWWYCLLILPYATALTIMQGVELVRYDRKKCFHLPMIFICRVSYHYGVWCRLVRDFSHHCVWNEKIDS